MLFKQTRREKKKTPSDEDISCWSALHSKKMAGPCVSTNYENNLKNLFSAYRNCSSTLGNVHCATARELERKPQSRLNKALIEIKDTIFKYHMHLLSMRGRSRMKNVHRPKVLFQYILKHFNPKVRFRFADMIFLFLRKRCLGLKSDR